MIRGKPKNRPEETCERALDQHEAHLASRQNVVGLGIVRLDEADDSDGDLAVAVYVSRKLPLDELPPEEVIPVGHHCHCRVPNTARDPVRGPEHYHVDRFLQ